VGEASSSGEAYSIPGPAYFRDTRAPARHTGGSTETPWQIARTTQGAPLWTGETIPGPKESHLKALP
jgi:hypothetical protein